MSECVNVVDRCQTYTTSHDCDEPAQLGAYYECLLKPVLYLTEDLPGQKAYHWNAFTPVLCECSLSLSMT